MAVTSNQLAVALFDAAIGGYKASVDAFLYAQGEKSAAEMMLRESGLSGNPDNGVFAYLVVDKMVGATLTAAQKQGAADILKAQLAAGQSRGDVVLNAIKYLLSDAAKADATYKNAAARFANKVAAADLYDGGSTDIAALKTALAAVTQDPATVPSTSVAKTFSLTAGPDVVVGSTGNDVINAMSINATGVDTKSLSDFDSIDGGDGVDTLNVYVKSTAPDINGAFPTNTTIKNVENVNLYNTVAPAASMADASKYVGVTTLKQIGNAAAVTNLAETTTASFKDTGAAALSVTAAAAAAKATVALDNVDEGVTLTVAGAALNNVIVTGTLKDTSVPADAKTSMNLNVTVGKDVQSLTVNTVANSTLTVTDGVGGTKKVTTVDAAASKGAITYTAAPTVTTVTTGEAADTVSLTTALSDTVLAAAVTGGAGDDTLSAAVTTAGLTKATTLTVTGGAGNDKITVSDAAGAVNMTKVAVSAVAGAGDDKVSVLYKVNANDVIDGGEGNDTVELAGKAAVRNAADFVTLNSVLQNFENLSFTSAEGTAVANLDAAQLAANYATISFTGASFVKGVGAQSLVANGNLTAETAGFKAGTVAPAVATTYAGTLNITEKGTAANAVVAKAEILNLTVSGGSANAVAANATTLTGDLKTATVTLSAGTDTKGTAVTTDDVLVASTLAVTTGTVVGGNVLADLTSLTLKGNGAATVTNTAGSALVTVNAAELASADIAAKAAAGLTYASTNAKAETITLGSGLDKVSLSASAYGTGKTMDTVTGLTLALNAAGNAFDATKGDVLTINGAVALGGFKAFTTASTNLDVALLAASTAAAGDKLVFQMAGNTYIYIDAGTVNTLDAADTIVKLTGTISLDTLIAGL